MHTLTLRDVLITPPELPSNSGRWRVTPIDGRATERYEDRELALQNARELAALTQGEVFFLPHVAPKL